MSQPFFLDKRSLSVSRVYQGLQEAQVDLSTAVPLDRTCRLKPRGYSQLCIFCRERYFSKFLLSFISLPYLPTVPSSDRIKWECMQLSVVSLLRGFPRVWYRHTTCKIARTRVRVPSWADCSKGLCSVCALQSSGPCQKVLLATKSSASQTICSEDSIWVPLLFIFLWVDM